MCTKSQNLEAIVGNIYQIPWFGQKKNVFDNLKSENVSHQFDSDTNTDGNSPLAFGEGWNDIAIPNNHSCWIFLFVQVFQRMKIIIMDITVFSMKENHEHVL